MSVMVHMLEVKAGESLHAVAHGVAGRHFSYFPTIQERKVTQHKPYAGQGSQVAHRTVHHDYTI
jgi:hypothetical protein